MTIKRSRKIGRLEIPIRGIYRHFAIMADNLEEIRESCLAAGGKINMEPTFLPQLGSTVMLIGDPNGVEIELILAK